MQRNQSSSLVKLPDYQYGYEDSDTIFEDEKYEKNVVFRLA